MRIPMYNDASGDATVRPLLFPAFDCPSHHCSIVASSPMVVLKVGGDAQDLVLDLVLDLSSLALLALALALVPLA